MNTPIRTARIVRNLSQHDAAQLAGVDQGQWSRIERGLQFPSLDVIFFLSETFELSAGEIFQGLRQNRELTGAAAEPGTFVPADDPST